MPPEANLELNLVESCDIGVELICANSPQAKGRVERANKTLQDRLIKEMRLNKISSIEEANAAGNVYRKLQPALRQNAQISKKPSSPCGRNDCGSG
jgi:hypothetical protein